jgi:hypothetical protein
VIAAARIDAILRHHGIDGPWQALTATGIANHIYATSEIVLRIATDHPLAVYESAAPALLGEQARARILCNKLDDALDALPGSRRLDELCDFIRRSDGPWRVGASGP